MNTNSFIFTHLKYGLIGKSYFFVCMCVCRFRAWFMKDVELIPVFINNNVNCLCVANVLRKYECFPTMSSKTNNPEVLIESAPWVNKQNYDRVHSYWFLVLQHVLFLRGAIFPVYVILSSKQMIRSSSQLRVFLPVRRKVYPYIAIGCTFNAG